MNKLIGLYIEDEPNNIDILKARFSLHDGIELIGMDDYPQKVGGFYDYVIENNVDFLIIDHELEKASVPYKGIDVLRDIRREDSTIYAVLLTNYPLEDYKGELGEYDFQLTKSELKDSAKLEELISKIKRACGLRNENNILAAMNAKSKEQRKLLDSLLQSKIEE